MLVVYADGSGKSVTISPRIADGHSEPSYQSDITVQKQDGQGPNSANTASGSRGSLKMTADGVCKSCLTWANGGSIDLTNTKQPFIFAVGPTYPPIESDSQSEGISRHEFYGQFTMDMTAATTSSGGSVPAGPYVQKDASTAEDTKFDMMPLRGRLARVRRRNPRAGARGRLPAVQPASICRRQADALAVAPLD